jgi:transposase
VASSLLKNEELAMPQERLTLRKIREILRLKHEVGLSNRAIARACKLSNSTVGAYLRRARETGVSWPLPEELGEEALYRQLFPEAKGQAERDRPLPDWEEVRRELSHKGVTLRLLWIEYREKYPDGYGYTQFCEYYRRWRKAHALAARLPRIGGEELEVDYAGLTLPIVNPQTGEIRQAPVFVATLPASNYLFAEVQPNQQACHWINGHVRAFQFFGGLPKILRPDNPKTGVKSPNYYEPDLNPTYQEMAEYYGVAVLPARVRKPRDKGNVENGVQNIERWVIAPLRHQTFFSEAEANQAMKPLLKALNGRKMAHLGKSRRDLFAELDQPALRQLPERPYRFAAWKKARVNIDYHVAFEKHFYSVSHTLVHQEVEIKATERLVEIFHQGKQVAIHPRSAVQGRFSTRPEHMPSNHRFVLELDAAWLLKQAEAIGPLTEQLITALLHARPYPEQAYRSCLGVLSLARKYPLPLMETACQRILEARLLSYRDLKGELEALARSASPSPEQSVALPAHENIRGKTYYH